MANWFINIHWYFRHGCKKGAILLTVLETVHLMSEHPWERRAEQSLFLQWSPKPVTGHTHKRLYEYGRRIKTWWMSWCPCRASSDVSRTLPGGKAELADGDSPTLHTWDRDGAGRQCGHSWSLLRWVALAAEAQLSHSPAQPEPGHHSTALSTPAVPAPSCFCDSGDALSDESINYTLGTNYCYTILEFSGRMAHLQVPSGFHKAFYFKSTQLINLVDILHR